MRRLLLWLLVLVVLGAIGFALWPRASTQYSASRTNFELPSLDGGAAVDLSAYRGKPVVVDLFATWCTACQSELPILAAQAQRDSGRVVFIGVDSRDTGNGLGMAKKFGIANWPLASDIGGGLSDFHDQLGMVGMPVAAFYNPDGQLVATDGFALTASELQQKLKQYFGVSS